MINRTMHKAYFFDMDGTLFDSMPHHAEAWERVMAAHGFRFSQEDCYINEGRTGQSVITEALVKTGKMAAEDISEELVLSIYKEKTDLFHSMGEVRPIAGVQEVLQFLQAQGASLWIVTGSGQQTLFDVLDHHFPGVFARERMITAFDVTYGKPGAVFEGMGTVGTTQGGVLRGGECAIRYPLGQSRRALQHWSEHGSAKR